MKQKPVKNYQKPRYAAALASVLAMAGSLTGCIKPEVQGMIDVPEDPDGTPLQLDGDVAVEEETCTTPSDQTEEVALAGEVAVEEETQTIVPAETAVQLAGDVAFVEDITPTED